VGVYGHEAEEGTLDTYTSGLKGNDRAICDGDEMLGGFVKVHCLKGTETIVGATVVAPHAGEMISELTVALQFKIPLGQRGLGGVIHPYPTVSDAVGGCGFQCKVARWGKVAEGGDEIAPMRKEDRGKDKRKVVKETHQEMGGAGGGGAEVMTKGFFGGVLFAMAAFVAANQVLAKRK
jgi:hypothetical protein